MILDDFGRPTDEALAAFAEDRLTAEERAIVEAAMADQDRAALRDLFGPRPAFEGEFGEGS